MRKLKKFLSALGAVIVCAVSLSPLFSNAIAVFINEKVTPYTTSFTVCDGRKYTLWQEATDYFGDKDFKVYISKWTASDGTERHGIMGSYYRIYYAVAPDKMVGRCQVCPMGIEDSYYCETEEDMEKLVSYLSENNIPYTIYKNSVVLLDDEKLNIIDWMQRYIDIKENTGFVFNWILATGATEIESVENTFPEKTLDGDANEDGEVNMSDATAVIQAIGNADKYGLTMQGIVNADLNGDGLTVEDAVNIQLKVAEAGTPE